jgi:RNA-binding protein YlmH
MDQELLIDGWARPEERPFVKRAQDLAESVRHHGRWRLTDFLSPREMYLLQSVANREGIVLASYGGAPEAERKRALLMPENWHPEADDFKTSVLRARTVSKAALSHGSVLGSLLGTGLERRKIGDVYVQGDEAYAVVCREVEAFLLEHWTQAGREPIAVDPVGPDVTLHPPQYESRVVSVASLRADAVVAQACHWSRTAAQQSIQRGLVSLNYAVLQKPDELLEEGDLLSIRGFGRVRVLSVEGVSRKGRQRVQLGILQSDRT